MAARPCAWRSARPMHGPILNDVDDRLAGAPLMAFRWTATSDAGPTARSRRSSASRRPRTSTSSGRPSRVYGAPRQNFVYADVDGHIGYQLPGHVPIRSNPTTVATGRSGFHGTRRVDRPDPVRVDCPGRSTRSMAGSSSANNAIVDADYPAFLGQDWDPGYRAERIIDLINDYAQDGLTVPEMSVIQNDTALLRARDIACS